MIKLKTQGYYINDSGNIYSDKSGKLFEMAQPLNTNGYKHLRLMVFGKSKVFYPHRLIAETFIPNPYNKPCVNHINGIKTDNRIENLEWCTYSENNQHAFDTKLKSPTNMSSFCKKLIVVSKCGMFLKSFNGIKFASEYLNIDARRVSEFLSNKRKHRLYNFIPA